MVQPIIIVEHDIFVAWICLNILSIVLIAVVLLLFLGYLFAWIKLRVCGKGHIKDGHFPWISKCRKRNVCKFFRSFSRADNDHLCPLDFLRLFYQFSFSSTIIKANGPIAIKIAATITEQSNNHRKYAAKLTIYK